MATATQRVSARIPGKDDEFGAGGKYAFIEFEASNVAEFEKLIAEARKSPAFRMYDFDGTMGRKIDAGDTSLTATQTARAVVKEAAKAAQKKTHTLTPEQKAKLVGKKETEAPAGVAEESSEETEVVVKAAGDDRPDETPTAESATSVSAPSDGEKLSPRDIARQKLLARKKGA